MFAIIHLLATIADLFKSRRRLEVENLFLRHQLNIALRRAPQRLRLRASDRALLVWMTRIWPSLIGLTRVVQHEAFPWSSAPAYPVRDNDGAYGHVFRSRVRAMGIRDRPITPGSPWQNPYVERLIGTVRRECLDGMLVFGEAHLRQILSSYAAYYNEVRTHLALGKDAPLGRAVQRTGVVVAIPILSGLHHHYVRI